MMLSRDQCLYLPGDLIAANDFDFSGLNAFGTQTHEEIGLVLAVTHTGSAETNPEYLILWERRGLVNHHDGHISSLGSRLLRRDT